MDTSELIKAINAAADSPPADVTDAERSQLLAACSKLRVALGDPIEFTLRVPMAIYESSALTIAINMGLMDAAAKLPSSGFTVDQLATATSAEPLLVLRLMRLLAAMGVFKELGPGLYAATTLAKAYVTGSPSREAFIHLASHCPAAAMLPDYFAEKGYKSPNDTYDGPFQYAMKTDKHYFAWMAERPHLQHAFNVTMALHPLNRGLQWFDFYPAEEKLRVKSPSDVLLVDVGGGKGHDLASFRRRFPKLPGKLILQDIPAVIEDAGREELPEGIEKMGHDFFTTQPVKGAKAYYLRTVLHDWPDKQARIILEKLRDAMTKDSVLLIYENTMPDANVPIFSAWLDFTMLATLAALERTVTQFKELLESAGFQLVQVWQPKAGAPGAGVLFEAVVKQ